MTIVELKKEYNKQLNILKDDKNGVSVRIQAWNSLDATFRLILQEEPKCVLLNPDILYTKYIKKLEQPDVVWYNTSKETLNEDDWIEIQKLEYVRKIAYVWVRMNHPKLNDQTDKFGQIVNARMQLIIANRQ